MVNKNRLGAMHRGDIKETKMHMEAGTFDVEHRIGARTICNGPILREQADRRMKV